MIHLTTSRADLVMVITVLGYLHHHQLVCDQIGPVGAGERRAVIEQGFGFDEVVPGRLKDPSDLARDQHVLGSGE